MDLTPNNTVTAQPPRSQARHSMPADIGIFADLGDVQLEARKQLDNAPQQQLDTWHQQGAGHRDGLLSFVGRRMVANNKVHLNTSPDLPHVPFVRGHVSSLAVGGLKALGAYSDALQSDACADQLYDQMAESLKRNPLLLKRSTTRSAKLGGPMIAFMTASQIDGNFRNMFVAADDAMYFRTMLLPCVGVFVTAESNVSAQRAIQTYGALSHHPTPEQKASLFERTCWHLYKKMCYGGDVKISFLSAQAFAQKSLSKEAAAQATPAVPKTRAKRDRTTPRFWYYAPLSPEPVGTQASKKARLQSPMATPDAQGVAASSAPSVEPLFSISTGGQSVLLTRAQIFFAAKDVNEMTTDELIHEEDVEFGGEALSLNRLGLKSLLGLDAGPDYLSV